MKESKRVRFTLCLFGTEPEGNSDEGQEAVTYTQEEFDKKLQSESDKRVTEALKTARENWQKEYDEKLEAEKSEAEKMAKLSARERAEEEFKKEKESFAKEKEVFQRERLELEARKELGKQGLNEDFASFLMQEDAETTLENIKKFKATFDEAVSLGVKEQLKGEAPKRHETSEPEDAFSMLNSRYTR